jgi:HNH endonuclease
VNMKLTFCAACGTTEGLNHHHLRPKVLGGSNAETNLITLCHPCHGLVRGSDWWEGNYWSNEHSELIKARIAAARAREVTRGRKGYATPMPETVALAKQLRADGLSYRKISAALAEQGHMTGNGRPHAASAIQKMLGA